MNEEKLQIFLDMCHKGASNLDLMNKFDLSDGGVRYWKQELRKAGHKIQSIFGRRVINRPKV